MQGLDICGADGAFAVRIGALGVRAGRSVVVVGGADVPVPDQVVGFLLRGQGVGGGGAFGAGGASAAEGFAEDGGHFVVRPARDFLFFLSG